MLTPEKKLRAGRSVWMALPAAHPKPRILGESIKVDVAIVGAGVSGAFMAHALARRYDKVVVLDRRTPGTGSTSASTAMLQFEIDTQLVRLREKIGGAKAARAWQRSFQSTQRLVRLVEEERIRCDLAHRHSLYLAGTDMGFRALEKECGARNRIGLPGAFLDRRTLRGSFGIDRSGAILSPGNAVANPMQLADGLLRRAIQCGVRLYAPAEVIDVMATPHGVVLDTGKHFIEARFAVFCTGYEVLKNLPRKGTKITSSWAFATRPHTARPSWLDRAVLWEAATPYLYMRTTRDGRVIVGGEDEDIDLPSYRARSLGRKTSRLVQKVRALVPGLQLDPAYTWTGAFGESEDGLPIIDEVPGLPRCFAVMGFGGNGTIYSKLAAEIVPTLLKGRPDRDADLYKFRQ